MYRILFLLTILVFFVSGIYAQYVNTDSLVQLQGYSYPVSSDELKELLCDMRNEERTASYDELLFDENVLAGELLRHFLIPANGKVISRYGMRSGRMHTGTDIKMNKGDTVYAVYQGTVTRAKYYYGYGNMVMINHGKDIETSYAHLSEFLVKSGQTINRMQPIGLAGSTGRATTSHLHFEIREANRHFNPEMVFDFENYAVKAEALEIMNLSDLLSDKRQTAYLFDETSLQSYIVSHGDSLWKISQRFKTSVKTLCALNDLNENSVLNVGMVLKLF